MRVRDDYSGLLPYRSQENLVRFSDVKGELAKLRLSRINDDIFLCDSWIIVSREIFVISIAKVLGYLFSRVAFFLSF